MSMTDNKTEEKLKRVSCIWYLIIFKDQIEVLLDSRSKVNAISQAFAQQLGLKICKTNIITQKINGIILETYKMVVFTFSISDKDSKKKFFEENFLLADVKPDVIFEMPFQTINNADINFLAQDLQ